MPASSSTGVLLFEVSGGVELANNRATRNDDNFAAFTTTGVTLTRNRASNSTAFDGFFFDVDTASNHLRRNVATGNKLFDWARAETTTELRWPLKDEKTVRAAL